MHAYLWDPWFLIWGLLTLTSLLAGRPVTDRQVAQNSAASVAVDLLPTNSTARLRRDCNGGTIAVMTPPGRLVAFAATRDLDRAERFYGGVLGLTILSKNPHAIAFDNDGTELRLTVVGTKAQAPYTVLGWSVEDLTAQVSRLRDRGVTFTRYPGMEQDADDAWTAPDGTRVAWFTDPDGSVLSLHETA